MRDFRHRLFQFAFLLSFASLSHPASAALGKESGGGDLCENRIQNVARDLKGWLEEGGAAGLFLPSGLSAQTYTHDMLNAISEAKISCVSQGDSNYPVKVQSAQKICRFETDGRSSSIICDRAEFMKLTENDHYVLVHHEFAGLAGVERPNGDVSTYEISNQITTYLEDTVIKRLVVRPRTTKPKEKLDGKYQLEFYSSAGQCEKEVYIQVRLDELATNIVPLRMPEYRFGAKCFDRSFPGSHPPRPVSDCANQVENNSMLGANAFESLVSQTIRIGGRKRVLNLRRFTLNLVNSGTVQADLWTFDRDGVTSSPIFRCVYTRVR